MYQCMYIYTYRGVGILDIHYTMTMLAVRVSRVLVLEESRDRKNHVTCVYMRVLDVTCVKSCDMILMSFTL